MHGCLGPTSSTNTLPKIDPQASQTGFPVLFSPSLLQGRLQAVLRQLSALRSPMLPSIPGLTDRAAPQPEPPQQHNPQSPGQPAQAGTSVRHPFARGTPTSMAALTASLQRIQQLPVPCLWCNGHKCPATGPAPLPALGTLYRTAPMQSSHNREAFKTA